MLEFIIGKEYRRKIDIHDVYGGQQQGGISTPLNKPYLFIFTGEGGKKYGYHDEFRSDGVFLYTGEGQTGDRQFIKGNLAIRDHHKNGKALLIFECLKTGKVRYIGQAQYIGHHFETRIDHHNKLRQAIIFELVFCLEASLFTEEVHEEDDAFKLNTLQPAKASELLRKSYLRSQEVKMLALARSQGKCEGCNNPAPFLTSRGVPFLEVHHLYRLTDGGPDLIEYVVALCPNCHRRIHYGKEGAKYNEELIQKNMSYYGISKP